MSASRADRAAKLRNRIADQRDWIDKCGGSLTGYILRYGSKNDLGHLGDGGEAIWAADKGELDRLEADLAEVERQIRHARERAGK